MRSHVCGRLCVAPCKETMLSVYSRNCVIVNVRIVLLMYVVFMYRLVHRQDSNRSNLRNAAYEALGELIKYSPRVSHVHLIPNAGSRRSPMAAGWLLGAPLALALAS